jgi:hypothetical protein
MGAIASDLAAVKPDARDEVTLTDFDPLGETKVVAAALYAVSELPDDQLFDIARRLSADERLSILRAYAGNRRTVAIARAGHSSARATALTC